MRRSSLTGIPFGREPFAAVSYVVAKKPWLHWLIDSMISCGFSDPSAIVLAPEKVGAVTSIFISYARNDDEAFVRQLHAGLTKAGFDVGSDRVSITSRQLTFQREIRDASAAFHRLLLLVAVGDCL